MYVRHLSLTDFRSYDQLELSLEPGVTALVGPNGQGKTNLVEAVGYVAGLGSHRVSGDAPLVRHGSRRAAVRAGVVRAGRDTLVEIEIVPGGSNRAKINRAPTTRTRDVLGMLRTVLFAPEDLALVKGDPDQRRRFVDDLLVARAPRFAGVRADLERVLKQRNALLRQSGSAIRGGGDDIHTLEVWDSHLAELGAQLTFGRLHLVQRLQPLVAKAYAEVSQGQGDAALAYRSSVDKVVDNPRDKRRGLVDDEVGDGSPGPGLISPDSPVPPRDVLRDRLAQALVAVRPQELQRGVSLVGPQRDDVLLTLGPAPAKGYASHGESWSFALALRLAAYELLRADAGESGDGEPVLILDDVFAELDAGRRSRLAELVAGAEQVLITAAVEGDVPPELRGHRVRVEGGQVWT
ncbi:MAG: DNA replication/repair protein RecF [Kineosporiaceae bacterium]